MRRFTIRGLVLATAVAGALAAAAPALAEPEVFASAVNGDLEVSSSILVSAKATDMRGGWLDETLPCASWRRLKVSVIIERVPGSGGARVVRKNKSRLVMNCAEGGPNMGFSLTARRLGMACPDGSWKPGRYSLATTTEHLASGLKAIASLGWSKRGAC
jgi:hypothetical protein